MDRYELAWAAGFFDGEGWAAAVTGPGRRTAQPQVRVNQADARGVPEVLVRFRNALGGLGRIGGPHSEERRIDLYRWEVSSRGDVELLHHFLAPWLGQAKLVEFSSALERAAATSRPVTRNDVWRSWAAGLYDGEGSTYLRDHRSHAGYRIGELAVTQSGLGGAPEVLRRFVLVLSAGHINGPYQQRGATMDVYRWKANSRSDIEGTIGQLWPWLGQVKRAQAQAVLDVLQAQPDLPRGRPDWGNRKTHCIHGHEYAVARVRPYYPRGRGVLIRENHRCLRCLREHARWMREKRRLAADDDYRSISDAAARYLLK
jgi:hypothetical protein